MTATCLARETGGGGPHLLNQGRLGWHLLWEGPGEAVLASRGPEVHGGALTMVLASGALPHVQ